MVLPLCVILTNSSCNKLIKSVFYYLIDTCVLKHSISLHYITQKQQFHELK